MGPTKPAEFEESMKENVLPPPTRKPCRFDFTQNLKICKFCFGFVKVKMRNTFFSI